MMSFLIQNNLLLLSSIMNQHIYFEQYIDNPLSLVQNTNNNHSDSNSSYIGSRSIEESYRKIKLDGYLTYSTNDGNTTELINNSDRISLNVPGKGITTIEMNSIIGGNNGDNGILGLKSVVTNFREDSLYSDWLRYLIRPQLFLSLNTSSTIMNNNKIMNDSSNGHYKGDDENVGDNLKRARFHSSTTDDRNNNYFSAFQSSESTINQAGDLLNPSIMFSTITNTYDGLNCLHISKNLDQAVGGFKDSIVRVWKLNEDTNMNHNSHNRLVNYKNGNNNNNNSSFGNLLRNENSLWDYDEVLPSLDSDKDDRNSDRNSSMNSGLNSNMNGAGMKKKIEESNVKNFKSMGLPPRPMVDLIGHSKAVYAVCQNHSIHDNQNSSGGLNNSSDNSFYDNGPRFILSSSADQTIRLWDTKITQCITKYNCSLLGPAWGVSFSPVGGMYYFGAAHQGASAAIYSTDRLTPLRLLTGHYSDVNSICWHENGVLVGTCSDDRSARLWDIRSGKCVRLFTGSTHALSCVAMNAFTLSTGVGSLIAAGTDAGILY